MVPHVRRDKRRFPRAKEKIRVELSIQDEKRQFQAPVYSTDISLTGIFFATEFFLKVGTELDLKFQMPNDKRPIKVRGIITREVRIDERRASSKQQSGFAVRFVEYYADAKTVLAASFLTVELDNFIDGFLDQRSVKPKNEREALREVIIAWEVGKMEIQDGELKLIRDRLSLNEEGRIRRH